MEQVAENIGEYIYIIDVKEMGKVMDNGITGNDGVITCYCNKKEGGWGKVNEVIKEKGIKKPIAVRFKYTGCCTRIRELGLGLCEVHINGYVPRKAIMGMISIRDVS